MDGERLIERRVYVRAARVNGERGRQDYPYKIPAIQHLEELSFEQPVTFIVGENGSGKSTIIEAMAQAAGFGSEGGTKNYSFETHDNTSELKDVIALVRNPGREKGGFFLRAESFYNVATESERLGMHYGGKSLHAQSHGESFLHIANERFEPYGLYFFDEPEAALSPQRQLALLRRMHNLVQCGSQFIIATHSPILLAYPGAVIYELSRHGVERVDYEETEHFKLTRDFLQNHRLYIKRLFLDMDEEDTK
jgi:predicted ATPase